MLVVLGHVSYILHRLLPLLFNEKTPVYHHVLVIRRNPKRSCGRAQPRCFLHNGDNRPDQRSTSCHLASRRLCAPSLAPRRWSSPIVSCDTYGSRFHRRSILYSPIAYAVEFFTKPSSVHSIGMYINARGDSRAWTLANTGRLASLPRELSISPRHVQCCGLCCLRKATTIARAEAVTGAVILVFDGMMIFGLGPQPNDGIQERLQ